MKRIFFGFLMLFLYQTAYCQNTVLWKVTASNSSKSTYVLGTFHTFGKSFLDKHPKITDILKQSDLCVFESLDADSVSAQKIINNRKEDFSLQKVFRKKEVKNLEEFGKKMKINLYKYTPVELSWKLNRLYTQKVCKSIEKSENSIFLDEILLNEAKQNNKELVGFETAEEQIEYINAEFKNLTWETERKSINFYLENINSKNPKIKDDNKLCASVQDYKNFKIDYQFEKSASLKILEIERNNNWIKELIPMIGKKDIFMAVGFLHLSYKEGLISQLKNAGFTVEPITID
jgi:uncharacterized protein YbaP (TraB family)